MFLAASAHSDNVLYLAKSILNEESSISSHFRSKSFLFFFLVDDKEGKKEEKQKKPKPYFETFSRFSRLLTTHNTLAL